MDTLETKRLVLRGWRLEDLDDLYEYARNPSVGPMAGWQPHSSREASLDVLKSFVADDECWAIALKQNRRVIGSVRMYPDENRGTYRARYINYALAADYWGMGYMPEAVGRVIEYAFAEMSIDLLSVFHYPHNTRSKRVIEKCGFHYEITLRQPSNGHRFDTVCYSLLSTEYCRG